MTTKLTFPESGYTPANLRKVMQRYGLTTRTLSNILGVNIRTTRTWLVPVGQQGHSDMPLHRWQELLTKLPLARQ